MKPSLSCPNFLELTVSSDGQEDYDLTSDVSSDGTLTFDPQSVTKSVSNIGKYVRIDVTAKNSHGTEAYCSFLVTFKGMYRWHAFFSRNVLICFSYFSTNMSFVATHYHLTDVPNEDLNLPVHSCSLIRGLIVHVIKCRLLGYLKCTLKTLISFNKWAG